MKGLRELLPLIIVVLVVLLVIILSIMWYIYKWHTFQDVTNSDIGYWKWYFLFNRNK